jgi:hypothetical protein
VVGVQDEEDVERALEPRVGSYLSSVILNIIERKLPG